LLRFLNLRYPHDYNTVPRLYFWLFHLAWLFPWSVYFPATFQLQYKAVDRAGKTRLLALCWIGFILVFFTFSTTQEYYSMPCYPAMALLLGSAMSKKSRWIARGNRALGVLCGIAALTIIAVLIAVRHVPDPGDISRALSQHPGAYTLSLGRMEDLTIQSFAYLRMPLVVAGLAFLVGTAGAVFGKGQRAFLAAVLMMVLFFQAARMALVKFDPLLSSRSLVQSLQRSPAGDLIIDHHYYLFSSVFFYTNRTAWLLNGRVDNLIYGSYAPGAPDVFLSDRQFRELWVLPERKYLFVRETGIAHLEELVGSERLRRVASGGGKILLTNQPLD
jgi:hypothetical protein